MPIYNVRKHLWLAVLSVLAQSFTTWELLIIDDGSSDNALNSIADITGNRIRTFSDCNNRG
jgi:glycosyltransferase involved in cell wall biosynthesis